jgi:N-acetyl-gamma-glutamylphosphate reductase
MELNKDKVFTLGQLTTAMDMARVMVDGKYAHSGEYIYNFIQQPTEIEVEIVTHVDLASTPVDSRHPDAYLGTDTMIPKLDSNGCLILKKI